MPAWKGNDGRAPLNPFIRTLQLDDPTDEAIWQHFVAQDAQSTIFCTPEMARVFRKTRKNSPEVWGAFSSAGELLALLPLTRVAFFARLPILTRAVAYGGVAFRPDAEGRAALEELLRTYVHAARSQTLFTELRHLADRDAVQSTLGAHNFVYEDHLDYLIDLAKSEEALLQSFGPSARKHLRRALRQQEVTVEAVTSREQVQVCYQLIQRSYQAAHVPLADDSLFMATFAVLHPLQKVKFWLAWVDGHAVASSVELLHKDTVYGWYSGIDRDYGRFLPGEVLMWHILKWSAANGYRVYDFGGGGRPDEAYPVRNFKAKFGGRLVCFGRNLHAHHPGWLWLSRVGYHLLHRWL